MFFKTETLQGVERKSIVKTTLAMVNFISANVTASSFKIYSPYTPIILGRINPMSNKTAILFLLCYRGTK